MNSLNFKSPTLMIQLLLIVLLLWSTNFDVCNARRSKHWRHSTTNFSGSLLKRKVKSHGYQSHNHHHSSKPKPKPKSLSPPIPSPRVDTPPMPSPRVDTPPIPNPRVDTPPMPSPRVDTPPMPSPRVDTPPIPSPRVATPPMPSPRVDTPPIPIPRVDTPPIPSPRVDTPPMPETPYYKGSPPKYQAPPNPGHPTPIIEIPSPVTQKGSNIFSVLDYGAKGDGSSDDTKAFQAAWADACKVESSTMLIPSGYQFLVGPITFSGPYCQKNIIFQVDGTIIAPTSPNVWKSNLLWWMDFTKLVGLTIQGKGVIDGSGSIWWTDAPYDPEEEHELQMIMPLNNSVLEKPPMPVKSELRGNMPSIKPTAIRFYGSINVTVTGITIQNSPLCHLKFDNCIGVLVYSMSVSSPGDSPNTDGIHLQNSKDVLIHSTTLACGDDCISIQTGCSNVYIHSVNCGPGHGISIGSLGRYNTKACVSNVTVRDVNMQGTMTGVRIKTWQGGSGSVQGITFSNIQVSEVQLPIVIDQFYCDHTTCKNSSTAVSVSGVTYQNIKGTYTVKPIHLACSDGLPCTDITLNTIQLKPQQERYHLYDPFCWQTFGELMAPIAPPLGCLQIRKPLKNKVLTDVDVC